MFQQALLFFYTLSVWIFRWYLVMSFSFLFRFLVFFNLLGFILQKSFYKKQQKKKIN